MRYEVTGTVMQTVSIDLARGEQLYSQTASMAWMTPTIRMDTHTGDGMSMGGALSSGIGAAAVGGILGSVFGNE
jgi:uncharacterized protein (AIM24 family)